MKKRVLLVDDEVTVRESLTRVLSLEGYDVIAAAGAPQALAEINGDPLDLALLDVDLQQERNGWDLVRELRATRGELPIVMITARAGQHAHPLAKIGRAHV